MTVKMFLLTTFIPNCFFVFVFFFKYNVEFFFSFYSDMVQYIPNEVSTKPAVKEDDKGQSFFLDSYSQCLVNSTFVIYI